MCIFVKAIQDVEPNIEKGDMEGFFLGTKGWGSCPPVDPFGVNS